MEVATGQPPPPGCELHRRLVVAVLVGLSLVGAEAAFVFMTNSDATKLAISTTELDWECR